MKKIIIFLTVVCIITTCFTISTFAAETTTIKAGRWEFKNTISKDVTFDETFNFYLTNSTANTYNRIKFTDSLIFDSGNKTSMVYYSSWMDSSYKFITVPEPQTVSQTFYNWFTSNATLIEEFEVETTPTECDGTACPVGDADHNNYCDDCGLPMTMSLRSTLLDYAHSEIERALSGAIPTGQYWLIVRTASAYPGGPDSYYLYISAEKFYLDGNTLLAGTGNALVHRALVTQLSSGDFQASGWSSSQTGSHVLEVSDLVDSSHGTSFFFQIPLWMEMEQVGEQALTEQAIPKVVSAMKIVTVSSVGLLTLVIALILLSTKFRRFLP